MSGETNADFLLEIGCEEIPAAMIAHAAEELQVTLEKYLTTENLLEGANIEAFGAPRRLVAMAPVVRLRQPDASREFTGPPKSVAYMRPAGPPRPLRASRPGRVCQCQRFRSLRHRKGITSRLDR